MGGESEGASLAPGFEAHPGSLGTEGLLPETVGSDGQWALGGGQGGRLP